MSADESTVWIESSAVSAPAAGEIHLWRIALAGRLGDESRLRQWLSPEESAQADRFHFARDQRRFVIRRAVLRQILAACLGINPLSVQFELGAHGKPAIADQPSVGRLRFSCSHSGDWALIALARDLELGVDLEEYRPMTDAEDVAKKYFSAVEISELASLPSALKTVGFFNCWTRKEAFIKALGMGLYYPLDRFAVSLSPKKPAALLTVADDPDALQKWNLISFAAVPNYSAALVFAGKSAALKLFTWSP